MCGGTGRGGVFLGLMGNEVVGTDDGLKLVEAVAPGDWRGMILALKHIISEEPDRNEAPNSNQEWAQMFLNRRILFLLETFMKKDTALEQTRLEERRLRQRSDVDWLGIKLLREELGWSLVEEGGEGCRRLAS